MKNRLMLPRLIAIIVSLVSVIGLFLPYIASTEEYREYLEAKGTEKIYDNVDLVAQDTKELSLFEYSKVYYQGRQEIFRDDAEGIFYAVVFAAPGLLGLLTQPVHIDTETGKLFTAGIAKASVDTLGGVKPGANLVIDENGVLSVDTADKVLESEKPVASAAVYAAMQNTQQKIVVSGVLKGYGAGGVSTAVAGEDYVAPQEGKNLSTNDYTNEEKQKLSGIETGANAYNHPTHSPHESGLYKLTVDEKGHVVAAVGVEKADITALGIPAQDTTYQPASTDDAGLLSAADKMKLDSVETGAEKNIPPTWTAIEGKPEAFTPASHKHGLGDISRLEEALAGKVDMETGKSLSTNDYTTAEKNKLAGLTSPVAVSVTLAAASWSDGTQTVAVAGVTATSSVIVQAAPESRAAWLDADVYCSAQGAGTLTFTCESAPETDLTANVLIVEVSG